MSEHPRRATFRTSTQEMAEHNGKTFEITGMTYQTEDLENPECLYRIRLACGTEITALTEEIFENWINE